GDQDAAQDARGGRLDLHVRLVGLDFEEHLALRDVVAFLLVPRDEAALVHRQPELREDYARDAHARTTVAMLTRRAPSRPSRCPRSSARRSSRGAARTGSASR